MAPAGMSFDVRPAVASDLGAILAINQSEVPHVGTLTEDGLRDLVAEAAWTFVVQTLEKPVGFIVALEPGADYGSENYGWFSDRYADGGFCYIDRVAVLRPFRRQGLGGRLYAAVVARTNQPWLTCEVNVDPPNPDSRAFHERLGFEEVGRQQLASSDLGSRSTESGATRVALLAKPLPD